MAESSFWWLLTGAAVAIELMTGTFYLLMLAIGLAAGALAAHLGFGSAIQLTVAAVLGAGSALVWRSIKKRQKAPAPASANRDVNLDIGEMVLVDAWQPDGTASVHYRGANWAVALRPHVAAAPGQHRIVEVVGNRLIVERNS
jgi:membrane protein implicated in regulation of membrane protease activity